MLIDDISGFSEEGLGGSSGGVAGFVRGVVGCTRTEAPSEVGLGFGSNETIDEPFVVGATVIRRLLFRSFGLGVD